MLVEKSSLASKRRVRISFLIFIVFEEPNFVICLVYSHLQLGCDAGTEILKDVCPGVVHRG